MSADMISDDIGDPEWLVVGLEGFWGCVFCVCIIYPLVIIIISSTEAIKQPQYIPANTRNSPGG